MLSYHSIRVLDIRGFLGTSSSKLTLIASSSESEDSEAECLEPSPPKKQCVSSTVPEKHCTKSRPLSSKRKYNKKWEEDFPWLEYDQDYEGAFCEVCRKRGKSLQRIGGAWITKPFNNWKKATKKMRAHLQSDVHIQSCDAEFTATRAMKEGRVYNSTASAHRRAREDKAQDGYQGTPSLYPLPCTKPHCPHN